MATGSARPEVEVPAGGRDDRAATRAVGVVALERLWWRLDELEQRLGGGVCEPHKVAGPLPPCASPHVADELVKVQVALSNIAGKRERIKILFKKKEQVIPSRAALLERVKNLQPVLDSASIQVVPDHAAKLQRLSQIQMQQQAQCKQFSDGVKTFLEDYNKTTLLLSKQFIQWNEILMQLEAAKEVKPVAE